MDNIRAQGYDSALTDYVSQGRPLLGICLGMQILSSSGDEMTFTDGLDLIPGHVKLLDLESQSLPVPHVGWNSLQFKGEHPIFEGLKRHVDFYFVHSYYFEALNDTDVLAQVDYGSSFPAIVGKDNIVGIQFHPEKRP